MEAAALLLAALVAQMEAMPNHLPPESVCEAYSLMTWDDPDQRASWYWYWAHMSRKADTLYNRIHYANEARRMVTSAEWAAQQWPVPSWWREPVPHWRPWR